MIITPIKTERIGSGSTSLQSLIERSVPEFHDRDILVITSKVVSLCEGRTTPMDGADKEALIEQEATLRLARSHSRYNIGFTITNHTLIPTAGIDESNGDGHYILWPADSQQTANDIRRFLCEKFGVQYAGVVITDSTSQPLRRGTYGIALAHSGFACLRDYVDQADLFGRPYLTSKANVAAGLAAAAVVTMGEGREQTPLCLVSDVPFVEFQDRDPSADELAELTIEPEDDLFAPFLISVAWQPGRGGK